MVEKYLWKSSGGTVRVEQKWWNKDGETVVVKQ